MQPRIDSSVWVRAALIFVATFVVYFPSLQGKFILDDALLLTDSRLIQAPDGLYRFWLTTEPIDYWPVSNSSLWFEWRLWGNQPTGYHVSNVILHAANAVLVWSVLAELRIPGGFFAALLFALHPVNVESVAWISQRKGLLAMLFSLLATLCYLRAERPSGRTARDAPQGSRFYWLSLALYVLAMLSKGSVAVLPPLLLGILWWQRPLSARDFVRTAPFFAVAVVLVLVTVWFQARSAHDHVEAVGLVERVLAAGAVVWFYLSKALAPFRLAFLYSQWDIRLDSLAWWLPLLAALAVTAILWWYRNGWSRPFLFAWGFFCVALVPVMGLSRTTFMEYSLVADHYQYIAVIGVLALAAAGWAVWQRQARGPSRLAANGVAAAVVGLFALLTWRQSGFYSDSITLYQASLDSSPDSSMAHNNLGAQLFDAGRLPEAIEHDQRALQLKPDYPEAHNNLGNALSSTGRIAEAIEHYKEALRIRPTYLEAHNNLGSALAYTGQFQEGIGHLQEALRLKPDYADARKNLEMAETLQRNAQARQ